MLEMPLLPLWLGLLQKPRFAYLHTYSLRICFFMQSNYLIFHLPQPGKFVFFIHRSNCFHQVLRDGKWSEEDASVLVPGDIISIKLGDIIPADARLLEGDPLKIDQVPHHAWLRNNCFKMLLISVKTHILTVPIFSIL